MVSWTMKRLSQKVLARFKVLEAKSYLAYVLQFDYDEPGSSGERERERERKGERVRERDRERERE